MAAEPSTLRTLGAITWGERLGIVRARAGLSYKELAARLHPFTPLHPTTLMRLEQLGAPPDDLRRRQVSTLVVLLCGYAPEDFGLSVDELPRRWDVASIVPDPEPDRRAGAEDRRQKVVKLRRGQDRRSGIDRRAVDSEQGDRKINWTSVSAA